MRTSWLIGLNVILLAAPLSAQEEGRPVGPVRGGGGAGFVIALPQGDFGNAVDAGYGGQLFGTFNVTGNGLLRLRFDAGWLQYGSEKFQGCFSRTVGCRVKVDVVTTNQIGFLSAGPELMLPSGFVRPYVNGGLGLTYFTTASHVPGGQEAIASTDHLEDGVFAVSGGAGLYIPIALSKTAPLAIDLSARYYHNGRASYLREGDIRDNPDGTISFEPRRTEADLITLQLGVSVGFRARR